MTKVRRFEDLICWQKARSLANTIHGLTRHPDFSKDFRLWGQILDAVGSVMHNIAEGCDAGTDPEFIRFLKMARRSASEVQSELPRTGNTLPRPNENQPMSRRMMSSD
jgi:four helix bundle protein